MSSGFDTHVEARLIGLRVAADESHDLSAVMHKASNENSSLTRELDSQSPMTDRNLSTQNTSYSNSSGVIGRRLELPDHALSLSEQASKNIYHKFVQNNLIIKQGILDKKKGLFAKRRMFLITEGPSIYYVDPEAMELKGTIPWTADLRIEQKDMKTFLIHVPGRAYHLTDPEQDATSWCKSLASIHYRYYNTDPNRHSLSISSNSSTLITGSRPTVPVTEL